MHHSETGAGFVVKLNEPDEPMKFGMAVDRVEPSVEELTREFGRDCTTMAKLAEEIHGDVFIVVVQGDIIERELCVPEDSENYAAPMWDVLKEIKPGDRVMIAESENGNAWIETGDVQVSVELIDD